MAELSKAIKHLFGYNKTQQIEALEHLVHDLSDKNRKLVKENDKLLEKQRQAERTKDHFLMATKSFDELKEEDKARGYSLSSFKKVNNFTNAEYTIWLCTPYTIDDFCLMHDIITLEDTIKKEIVEGGVLAEFGVHGFIPDLEAARTYHDHYPVVTVATDLRICSGFENQIECNFAILGNFYISHNIAVGSSITAVKDDTAGSKTFDKISGAHS